MGEDTLPELLNKELCTGCTACVNACPSGCLDMLSDEYGFAYPFVSDPSRCISCGMCETICPARHKWDKDEFRMPPAYAAYSKDQEVRQASSSGGVFSEFACEVLSRGGVVYGAAWDDGFRVVHTSVERIEDLYRLRGAKYSESSLGKLFSSIQKELSNGREVMFAGTPCQVSGLMAFLGNNDSNLLCIDFICHGIPSPVIWEQYLKYRAGKDAGGKRPETINLRDKKSGWSRYRYSNLFQYYGGKEYRELSTKNAYMKLFTGNLILRESCGSCSFKGYRRASDITLGDFWGIWEISPEMDDDKGTSAVLLHSEKGEYYWEAVKERVCWKEVPAELVGKGNPSLLYSSHPKTERNAVLETIRTSGFEAGYALVKQQSLQHGLQRITVKVRNRLISKLRLHAEKKDGNTGNLG